MKISWNLADRKSAKSCVIYRTKKTQFPLALPLSLLRGSHPKSVRASPKQYARVPQISSKSVHFRRSYSRTREHGWNAPQSISNYSAKLQLLRRVTTRPGTEDGAKDLEISVWSRKVSYSLHVIMLFPVKVVRLSLSLSATQSVAV